ncbi:LacI family DNA-binding transcriptional regulator [Paractinoplanes atraurantiacus]|uniref:LacI family transcriptional regulator n=1 Tax=Paractinoplanes atraurantiacus TaxID=1036182 RepID=A0A285K433_9ACTN|nr:LacI family DNA-binding transcriptional regulator [Actinoplanes atraurantiacus]SNY67318.1 LacI family transcriptional regulator [Actinoplanes atraurantiacus]
MRYRIREIAAQAGLSAATVDRVLHERGGVRESTVLEVRRAIDDLDRQRSQLAVGGRTFLIDLVVQAPPRFSAAVRAALEAALPDLRPAVVRARFHLLTSPAVPELLRVLADLRGSHGVILKAPNVPGVVAAVNRLDRQGVPVVTLVTDLPGSRRVAYVGVDNRAAGATAAYLIAQWLGSAPGEVLVVRGHGSYRGEDERDAGFRAELRCHDRRAVEVVDEEDRPSAVHAATRAALAAHPGLVAVYSMYAGAGGTTAVVNAFRDERRSYQAFIAHDLDADNTPLLRQRRISAVLHHDLRQDLRAACRAVLRARKELPGTPWTTPSATQVITPHNAPPVEF